MLVANSFDLWLKDAFFSAAEEVQESADILESAYRTWVRVKREGLTPEALDDLSRELQTALGTAKWQLEEFDRAVRLSYQNRPSDNSRTRHRQFVAAIENQISHVESALMEYLNKNGNQPLRWVNLDKEECNDLAMFLSGTSRVLNDGCVNVGQSMNFCPPEDCCKGKAADIDLYSACNRDIPNVVRSTNAAIIDVEAKEVTGRRVDLKPEVGGATGSKRTLNTSNSSDWKIAIADEYEQSDPTPKEKGSKLHILKLLKTRVSLPNHLHMRGINGINQLFGRVAESQRQPHSPQKSQYNCSVQLKLALMLTIFLIVPFVLYST